PESAGCRVVRKRASASIVPTSSGGSSTSSDFPTSSRTAAKYNTEIRILPSRLALHDHATGEVRGYTDRHPLRRGQLEIVHQRDERVPTASGEARVLPPLFADRRHGAALVVVTRVHEGVARQREQFARDAVVQGPGVTPLEVGPPAPVDEERVPGEQPVAV